MDGRAASLFAALFDDAALFPPADLTLPQAVRCHARHRLSWYAGTVGPFVCRAGRLDELAAEVAAQDLGPVAVAAVVPEGVEHAASTVRAATGPDSPAGTAGTGRLTVRAVEAPVGHGGVAAAARALGGLPGDAVRCYVEIAPTDVTARAVRELGEAGLRLKLRTGGTRAGDFCTEDELAAPLVMCAAERLPFKCTAGLHNAVRHRDRRTGFEHHGFLNVLLAVQVAADTGSAAATSAVLAERGASELSARARELDADQITAIRALFDSFGTCSVDEPIADLRAMGLVSAP